jgi:prolyl oligopeptidase
VYIDAMRLLPAVSVAALAACGGGPPTPATLPVTTAPLAAPSNPSDQVKPPVLPPQRPWPSTRRQDLVDTIHGVPVADPFRWLENESDPEVQAWMEAQDAYARAELAKLPGREALAARLRELFYYDAISAPIHRKGRYFFSRKHADKEKTIVYWRAGERGAERVLFDPNQWSADGSRGLGGWSASHDGAHVAYAVKLNNSDESETKIRDVAAGTDLPDTIPGTKYGGISWAPDGKGFYYTWVPPVSAAVTVADRPGLAELRFHRLGTDPATDPVIYPATKNPQTFVSGSISRDGKWLVVLIQHGWRSTDIYFKDARAPRAAWTPLVAGVDAVFNVEVWRDRFYVTTNHEAPRYRVFEVHPRKPERAAWKQLVAESESTLQNLDVVGEHLVLTYLRNAASEVQIHTLGGKLVRKLDLPPLGTSGGISGNPDEDTGYLAYTSFTEPQVIYQTSIRSGQVSEWARVKLPVDTRELVAEQLFYPSKDGTKISMFVLHKKGLPKTGKQPTILYGYGGFNVSLTPSFASSRAVWLERGGVYAIPNLRGGGEYGEEWHRAGMLLNKQTVFDDFIAAAEALIREGWTSPAHLAISGGSNGGLLVGAAMTQRPELFKAVVCAVPLLDMLRYHLHGSGKTWISEYGSADDRAQFQALRAYSPYHRAIELGQQRYPAVLFDSADHDDRVDPMHARKLAAQLQHTQLADAPVLLRIERNAGHGGADMVKSQVERLTDQLALLESLLR